jgi:hypothetical protein
MKLVFLMRPQEILKGQANMRFMNFFCLNCLALKSFDKTVSPYVQTKVNEIPAAVNDMDNHSYCVKAAATTQDRHKCIAVKCSERWYKKL